MAPNRRWEVLYCAVQSTSEALCITRNECSIARGRKFDAEFIRNHRFPDFAAASKHIEKNAEAAKKAAALALDDVQVEDVCRGFVEYLIAPVDREDPRVGIRYAQRNLIADTTRQLNAQCAQAGFGVLLPLGEGHPISTVAAFNHKWSEAEQRYYARHGELPITTWSQGADEKTVVILRLQNHVSAGNVNLL